MRLVVKYNINSRALADTCIRDDVSNLCVKPQHLNINHYYLTNQLNLLVVRFKKSKDLSHLRGFTTANMVKPLAYERDTWTVTSR